MARVLQMMAAQPGMYAKLGDEAKREYRLIVMWALVEVNETGVEGEETQDIIGLTAADIANGEITHSGYKEYTTAVPKDSATVKIVR